MGKKKRPEIKVGTKFHWWRKELWHIVNVFKDGDETMVVLKSWAKYRNKWVYEVDYAWDLEEFFDLRGYD